MRSLSVFHNVYVGRLDRHSALHDSRNLAWPVRADDAAVRTVLGEMKLEAELFRRAGELPGGQQPRASVALPPAS